MKTDLLAISPPVESHGGFTVEQKEFLAGFMAGAAQRNLFPYVGATGQGQFTADPRLGGANLCAEQGETIFGVAKADVTKQERWKHEEHPLDSWERLLTHADAQKFPNEEDTFRFRYFGLFYVAPAQESFMLRCRIPAGELTAVQLRGLADIAEEFGNGKAAITTRSNIQIREIPPRHLVNVVTRLQTLGLTSKGSGVDNVRNITASPTAGFDCQELIDTRPFAHALHHYILNQRDLYNLPRKFNVAFEGGGAVDTVAETNDIGFMAVRVGDNPRGLPPAPPDSAHAVASRLAPLAGTEAAASPLPGQSRRPAGDARHLGESRLDSAPEDQGLLLPVPPGVYFRVHLAGITGHKQLAQDAGLLVKPSEAVAVAAAMIRVFIEHGDRTDRKKARLKYLIDRWGVDKFLEETQRKLSHSLVRFPLEGCRSRPAPVRHGHLGVYRQRQKGKSYIGAAIPVGIMTSRQMRRLADLSSNYGSGALRLTPWQNLLIPGIPDGFVETVKRQLVRIGFHYEASSLAGGLVACTGNKGCKYAATDTKGHAVDLARNLDQKIQLDQPINIHLTGCPHSCAQHYAGDIGLQGVKVNRAGDSVEGYNVVLGGATGAQAGIGQEVFKGISAQELPGFLERVLRVYLKLRHKGETFVEFARRHSVKELQELFSS